MPKTIEARTSGSANLWSVYALVCIVSKILNFSCDLITFVNCQKMCLR